MLMLTTTALADAATAASEKALDLGIGYRRADLDWNIGGGVSDPNIVSELTWSDLEIIELRGRLAFDLADESYLEASLSYGWIRDGENQDSDYAGNDRTLEYSRSNNDGDDDMYMPTAQTTEDWMAGRTPRGNALYRNNGDGTFTDVAEETGGALHHLGSGAYFSDHDNDGDKDLFVHHSNIQMLHPRPPLLQRLHKRLLVERIAMDVDFQRMDVSQILAASRIDHLLPNERPICPKIPAISGVSRTQIPSHFLQRSEQT